ncbi:B12-binding domain-containing radical SAM protein [Streptomyces sp. NPDC005533]|uniref:B12-binding domain-containing radical SAM protein n=1 Tax=Streptomyces sp. NPDC005533 TaxID=3364723 RepID=UPI003695501D
MPAAPSARVALVRPLLSTNDFNGYPLNLLILASALRAAGHHVAVFDFDYLKEVDPTWLDGGFARRAWSVIADYEPDCVGITAMCSNYALALDLAREVKHESPAAHVTLGGPHVSLCPLETLNRYPGVDTAVVGEGEITYPELITAVMAGTDLASVAGIAYRTDGHSVLTPARPLMSDLAGSPRPAYDLVDVPSYVALSASEYFEVYAGSGCPFNCSFCSTSIVWQRRYRNMDAERIVDEFQDLSTHYGATAFNLIHDNLTTRKSLIRDIAAEIDRRQLRIRWGFSSRVDTIDAETAAAAARSGCDYIFFGVESASEATQRDIKKRLRVGKIRAAIEFCTEVGIAPTTSFILGFPSEGTSDVDATIRLAFESKVRGARRSFLNMLSPYTGTEFAKQYQDDLVYSEEIANGTMSAFHEPVHHAMVQADPFVFSSHYLLDYRKSSVDATTYLNLVNFFNIALFRLPFSMSYVLNDLGRSPLSVLRNFEHQLALLTRQDVAQLVVPFRDEEFLAMVDSPARAFAADLLRLDHALHAASTTSVPVLFASSVDLSKRAPVTGSPTHCERSYLLRPRGDRTSVEVLDPALFRRYLHMGLRDVGAACESVSVDV